MSPRVWIFLGAVSAAVGVGMGAYHAHGLEKTLAARDVSAGEIQVQLRSFEVGVRYQMYHALALVLLGLLAFRADSCWFTTAGVLFVLGTLLFSGCLYVPVLAQIKLPFYLVPSGGMAFIVGWVAMAIGALVCRSGS